jgi:multidrug resistance protein MdtO
MARSAGEPRMTYVLGLLRLLQPQPGRFELATRLAVICALTVCAAEIYQTPDAALTTYIVFFLNRGDRVTSLIMNVAFVVLISVIIGLILLVALAVLDDPMWRVVSITVISFCFLFLASGSKLRPIGSTVALIVGYALDEFGMIQIGEEGTRALLYVWLFIGIPAGLSILVNLLFAPSPRRLAERAIALRLELAAAMLRAPDENVRDRFRECQREGVVEIQSRLKLADLEKSSPAQDIAALRQAADSSVVLLSAIDVMDRDPDARLPDALRQKLARALEQMAAIFTRGGYPVEIASDISDEDYSLSPLASKLLADIRNVLVRFADPPSQDMPVEDRPVEDTPVQDARVENTQKRPHGFFEPDAFSNPVHVQYALKTTAAAMFCYFLYSLLDWPGIHTCFLTCYIVSLGTMAETVEKLTLRILGCLIGAAAGYAAMIFLIPALTSIGALMIVVFLGACAAGYVAAGSERISYAGFQIAFAFFLCVIQGPGPAFDLTTARDRVIGILLGNVVVYLLFTNVWPVSVGKRIDPAIAALLRHLSTMTTTANPKQRRTLASQAQKALASIESDIELAAYEPATIRPSEEWRTARQETLREISALEGPLLLNTDRDVAKSALIANRLDLIANRFEAPETLRSEQPDNVATGSSTLPLFHIIETHLRSLEDIAVRKTDIEGSAIYAPT